MKNHILGPFWAKKFKTKFFPKIIKVYKEKDFNTHFSDDVVIPP